MCLLCKHKEIKGRGYKHYDNFDAIEVNYYDAIPSDYDGLMGVAVTFLDKHCPEQFEIVGICKTWFGMANKTYPKQIQVDKKGNKSVVTKLNDGAAIEVDGPIEGENYYIVDGKCPYFRILIRHKHHTMVSEQLQDCIHETAHRFPWLRKQGT